MKRTYIKDLKNTKKKSVEIRGWLQTIRNQGKIKFLIVRDVTGVVQCVINTGKEHGSQIQIPKIESVITVVGDLVFVEHAPNGYEIHLKKLEVLSFSDDLPIQVNTPHGDREVSQEKRLDLRWLDLRKPERYLIFKAWTVMEKSFVDYCSDHGYINIHSPKLLSVPSEGASELFELPYFGKKAYLAQSPQLYKQMAQAAGFEKVFEIGPVFRANPSFTSRHDTEFTGYDLELSFIDSHHDVMDEEEGLIVQMLRDIKGNLGEQILDVYGVKVTIPERPFPRITMQEAKKILKGLRIKSEKEGDLSPEEERELSKYILEKNGHEFVFVTDYPAEVRPFYHMKHKDNPSLTNSFDLLWKGIEITTGAQREHRYDQLKKQAIEKGLTLGPLGTYLDFFKYGCPPHGGVGFGPSRFLMKLFELANVREVTYLYRGVNRLTP